MKINYLDLFSGIGGFSKGLQEAGVEFGWHGFCEIDKYASSVYKRWFPNATELGSVTNVSGKGLPKLNLITFGFPCQDLSIAGKRRGLDGKRSGLFFEAIRIINETKPDYFVFENVKGLLSSNDGKDFETVLRTIADIGYDGQWQLLNTSWFLPQNRERIYFVGHPRTGSRPEVFPITESSIGADEIQRKTGAERSRIQGGVHEREPKEKSSESRRGGVNDLVCVALTEQRTEEAKKIRKLNMANGKDYSPRRSKELTARKDNNANTITAGQTKEQLICVASRGRGKTNKQTLEARPDSNTNSLTSVQKDNLILCQE